MKKRALIAIIFLAFLAFPAAAPCGTLSQAAPPRATLVLAPLSGRPEKIQSFTAALSPGKAPGSFTAVLGDVAITLTENNDAAPGRSALSCRADLSPLCGKMLLAGLWLTLPAGLGEAPDPAKIQACLGCANRTEVFRMDMTDERTFQWLISDKQTRWPPWISGGIAVTQAERLCWKLSCDQCAPVVVDHAASDWADLSLIGQKGLTFWADGGSPFGLSADLRRMEISLYLHPPAALPVPACGTLSRSFGLARHPGHRPLLRGKSTMDASDAARLLAARSIPEKRLEHLCKGLALPAPENPTREDLIAALASSMVPLRDILSRLEPFELKSLARALDLPAPRPNSPQQDQALDAIMQKLRQIP